MQIIQLSSQLPFEKSVGRRFLRDIEYAIIHHDAILASENYDELARYKAEADYHIKKGWGHFSYHLKVARNGKVYQTLPFEEIGYHAGSWKHNKFGIGICLDGSFDRQSASSEQLTTLKTLMNHLATERPDLPRLIKRSFFAHKTVRFWPTYCPGPVLSKLIEDYKKS